MQIEKTKTLFENESFIVVDKPAETLSVPARTGENDSRPVVGTWLQKKLGTQIYPVHRLDFEVSGVLMFAKNPNAHRFANAAFENHRFLKTYHAVAPGPSKADDSRWVDKLVRGKKRSFVAEHGKEAVTLVKKLGVIGENPQWELWELNPVTGRSHQLRVQMMLHQNPIVGDDLYGSRETWPHPGIALRAVELHCPEDAAPFGLPKSIRVPGFSV